MYTISKEFHFSASHRLEGLPMDHPCSRYHGHNYVVRVELANAVLNAVGFVIDYRELEPIKLLLDDVFDHQNLNELLDFNPTAENMAKHLYGIIKTNMNIWQVKAVEVSETPKTNARYEPTNNQK